MGDPKVCIRTPMTVHLRRVQQQLVPVLVFFASLWSAVWLWQGTSVTVRQARDVSWPERDAAVSDGGTQAGPPTRAVPSLVRGRGRRRESGEERAATGHDGEASGPALTRLDNETTQAAEGGSNRRPGS